MGWFGSYVVFMQAIGTWTKEQFIFTTIHNYKSEILFVPLSCETSFIAKMETQVCKNLYKIVV